MSDNLTRETCLYFKKTEQKVPNDDIGAPDAWRFVKRVRCGHADHPCNGPPAIGVAPRCQGDISKCEIPHIWQT
jgi:hypothetical protein